MELTVEEKGILAHIVVDPDAWVAHALEHGGEKAVTAKIESYRADYLSKKGLPDYKNRVERDAFELAQAEANKPIPTIDELRRAEFPNEHDLIVALWERIIEDRPESSNILQAERVIVKEKFPK